MIELMEEKIFKIKEFEQMDSIELHQLREEISNRINWRLSTENYDTNKIKKLMANESKINKVIYKEVIK